MPPCSSSWPGAILTDPVLTDRVAFIRRTVASPDPDHQQAIDLVLISHGHLDHLHRASLEAVGRDVPTIVPRGMGAMVRRWGFRHVPSPTRTSVSSWGR